MKNIKEKDMWIWLRVEEKESAEDVSKICAQMNEPREVLWHWLSMIVSSTAAVLWLRLCWVVPICITSYSAGYKVLSVYYADK